MFCTHIVSRKGKALGLKVSKKGLFDIYQAFMPIQFQVILALQNIINAFGGLRKRPKWQKQD